MDKKSKLSTDLEKILNLITETKYIKFLDRPDKQELIAKIIDELSAYYYDITNIELKIISQNIYDFSCLYAQNIDKHKIVKYIISKGSLYYNFLSERQIRNMNFKFNKKVFKALMMKYTKIIISRNKLI